MTSRRRSEPAIPPNFERLMTARQLQALTDLKALGWRLAIIRRPKFEPTEVILRHGSGKYCLLSDSGELDYANAPKLRRDPPKRQPVDDSPDPWANANDDSGFEADQNGAQAEPVSVNNEPVPKGSGKPKGPTKFIV